MISDKMVRLLAYVTGAGEPKEQDRNVIGEVSHNEVWIAVAVEVANREGVRFLRTDRVVGPRPKCPVAVPEQNCDPAGRLVRYGQI
jgi:hypothetical protein